MIARLAAAGLASLAMAGGCQLMKQEAVPALLMDDSPDTMGTLTATLAEAVGRASVDLGPGSPAEDSTITVLPPPLGPMETASMAMPTRFTLMKRGDTCMVVHSETGEEHLLDLPCRPAAS